MGLLTLTLALSSFVAMGQTKQNFELIPFDHNYHLMFSTGDKSGNTISIWHDGKGIVTFSFGEMIWKGTIINHKLILAKPYSLSYDTCRQSITILNTKAKKSYSIRWYKQPIYLTNLKIQ